MIGIIPFETIARYARAYLDAGIDGEHLESSHRAGSVNGICFSTSLALLAVTVVDISRASWFEVAADLIYLLTFQLPVLLNYKGRFVAARRILMVTALLTVTTNSFILGSSFMTNSLYIPVAAVACLIFPPDEKGFRRMIAFGAFFMCCAMQFFEPAALINLAEHDQNLMQYVGTVVVFGLVCAACYHASAANFNYVRRLRESFASETKAVNQAHATARLALLGELAAGVAHEINNPLAIICGRTEMLQREIERSADKQKMSAYAQSIQDMSLRIGTITKNMLAFARPTPPKSDEWFNVQDACHQVINLFTSLNQRHLIRLTVRLPADDLLLVRGNHAFFQQIILNLLTNARDALSMAEQPEIVLTARRSDQCVIVAVSDNGQGIAPDIAQRIMDPFFTTKEPGAGTGLGLSISTGLASSMSAALRLTSLRNPTTFELQMQQITEQRIAA